MATATAANPRNIEKISIYRKPSDDANFVYYHIQAMGHFADVDGKIIPGSNFSLVHEVGTTDNPDLENQRKDVPVELDSFNSAAYNGQTFYGYEIHRDFKEFDQPFKAAKVYIFYNVMYMINEYPDLNIKENQVLGGVTRFQRTYNSGLACMVVDLEEDGTKSPEFKFVYSNDPNMPGDGGATPQP